MLMATKLRRRVTYLDDLLPIKSHYNMIMGSCKITQQTNTIISPLPQCLWPANFTGWRLTLRDSDPQSQMMLWSRGLAKPCDKLNPLDLQHHSAHSNLTSQDTNLPWGLLPIKSHNLLLTWSCKITWQTKTFTSPTVLGLWPPKTDRSLT